VQLNRCEPVKTGDPAVLCKPAESTLFVDQAFNYFLKNLKIGMGGT